MNLPSLFNLFNRKSYFIKYWLRRVEKYGKFAVLNLNHNPDEWEKVTEYQKNEIYPVFRKQLRGDESLLLDFGCGPGRFTSDLAEIINGRAIGVDIVPDLLKMAPSKQNVSYCVLKDNIIPMANNSFDIIWSCLVLGGINHNVLKKTAKEFNRILKKNGLLFLVENTTEKQSSNYWFFRPPDYYKELFSGYNLEYIKSYFDFDERISIMTGRKID